jgi:hypothetical protein
MEEHKKRWKNSECFQARLWQWIGLAIVEKERDMEENGRGWRAQALLIALRCPTAC